MNGREALHNYQERAVSFITENKRVGLFLSMGCGKSLITLTAITDMLDGFCAQRVLVIAPLRVANSVWAQEAKKWAHTKHLSVNVCTGTEKRRLMSLQKEADIYVINRENIPWLVKHYGTRWPFETIVVDESSSFKSSSSQRFKALKKVLPYVDNIVLLTGTPSPNGLLDLWSQCYLVDFGKALGKTMTAYKQRFFETDYMGYKFTPRQGASEQIHSLIQPFIISMAAEDYLELPDRIDLFEPVYLTLKELSDYKDFEKDLFLELDDGNDIEAMTAAVLANKLLQYANGAVYVDDKKNWSELHTKKLDALAELIEQNEGENLLIAYNYKSDLTRLLAKFPEARVLDQSLETIDSWNRGEIKLLLAHPQSAGHGINLQHGGSLIVWFGLCWSLENYQQFNARLHRQGQEKPVRIVHLICQGTIDERVVGVLGDKDATQAALLRALK